MPQCVRPGYDAESELDLLQFAEYDGDAKQIAVIK